jgi:DNA-binding GntR family transcriptional regulator
MPFANTGRRFTVLIMVIDHGGPRWPYLQVADRLRELAAGMEPDTALPSIERLCQEYGVSPKTARKAIRLLEDEGLVYTVASRGTYVVRR